MNNLTVPPLIAFLLFPGGLFLMFGGMAYEWIDRKLVARLQNRVGPRWFQPLADIVKLLAKEEVLPDGVHAQVFYALPVIALTIGMCGNVMRYTRNTMLDVAKACGISYQTVSRVINNSPNVSAKTRRQVLKAIQSLGYHPNQLARSLKTRRSSILEVITFGVETYIPRELIVAMGRAAIAHGYSLMFTDIPQDDPAEEMRLYAHLNSGLCEAAILTAPVESKLYEKISSAPPPLPLTRSANNRAPPPHPGMSNNT